MRIGVCGNPAYGSWQRRGAPLVDAFGWDQLAVDQPVPREDYDCIILAKRNLRRIHWFPTNLRQACKYLILDPLDWWTSDEEQDPNPVNLWRHIYRLLEPDYVIATSSTCKATMIEGFPEHVRVFEIPHPCDPSISSGWYDPLGPVVYAGAEAPFEGLQDKFQSAIRRLDREFRIRYTSTDAGPLKGASLQVCMRNGIHMTPLNELCRPLIKLENAAAATMPVLCNGTPAELSRYPYAFCASLSATQDEQVLAHWIELALASHRLSNPYTEREYVRDMGNVVNRTLGGKHGSPRPR